MRVMGRYTWFPIVLVLLGCTEKFQDDSGSGSSSLGMSASSSNLSEGTSSGDGCGDGASTPGTFCFKKLDFLTLTSPHSAVGGPLHGEVQASFVVVTLLTDEVTTIEHDGGNLLQGAPVKLVHNSERQLRLANFGGSAFPEVVVTSVIGLSGWLANNDGVLGPYEDFMLQDSNGIGRLFPIDIDGDGLSEVIKGRDDIARLWIKIGEQWMPQGPSFAVDGCKVLWDAAVGDFNNDGLDDIAFIGSPSSWDSGTECDPIPAMKIRVLLATGKPDLLKESALIPTGQASEQIVTGDFDGDKLLDLAVASGLDEGVIALRGLGDGQFAQPLSVVPDGKRVLVGDFDGDGVQELATNRYTTDALVAQVWIVDSVLSSASLHQILDLNAALLASADINGDGVDDMAMKSVGPSGSHFAVLLSDL